jgi:hypothetical protein
VQILLAKPDNPGQAAFECQELALENSISSMANLRLGMAVTIIHVIRCAASCAAADPVLVCGCSTALADWMAYSAVTRTCFV